MKTEIKRQYEEQISDMFQTIEDFSDTPLKPLCFISWVMVSYFVNKIVKL